jgi:putative hydrolase of the HAD superfamily
VSETRAVLLDVLGTLLRMEAPGPRLRTELAGRIGTDVGEEAAARAFRAEIDYYLAHQLEGRDRDALERLRDRCARVVLEELGLDPGDLTAVREAMLAAIRFEPWPDAAPALERLRAAGIRLVAASNWDCSLPQVLERTGLADLLDGVAASAVVGAAKPDPVLFRAALELAERGPEEALHVGDSLANDVRGARAAGIRALLVARDGTAVAEVPSIRTLEELPALVLSGR